MSGRGYWNGRSVSRFRWELLRERAQLDDDAVPPARECEARPLADHFDAAFKGLHLEDRLFVSRLGAAWEEMVGATLARHSRPADLERGVLAVWVSHPGFLMELRGKMTDEILGRIRARFPSPRIVRLRWEVHPLR